MWASVLASICIAGLAWRIYRVRSVRYNVLQACQDRYRHLHDSLEKMTYNEANDILKVSHYWDFPWSLALADSLALFKTYAIPTISSLLAMTGELSSPERAGRRAEDTGIFVVELLTQGLDSVRGSVTLARMNYIHSRWSKHISRDDMLFTLSLFIFEPITFAAKYEWRAHSPLERQAIFMFWAEIGARMGIEDIPATLEELRDWKEQYATDNMIYAKTNGLVGELTMDVLVAPLPSFLKSFGKEAAKTFIEPRVLQAFGWEPASPAFLCWLMPALLHFRGLILRNLIFPRTRPPKFELTSEIVTTRPDGSEDRLVQREGFLFEPWYVAPGQSAIGKFGIGKPGDKVKWLSEGWKSETLGPDRLMDQGVDFAITEGERIRQAGMLCPFFRPTYK